MPYIKPKKHTDCSENQYNFPGSLYKSKTIHFNHKSFLYWVKDWHILISAVDFDVSQKSRETKAVSIWYADDNFKDYD